MPYRLDSASDGSSQTARSALIHRSTLRAIKLLSGHSSDTISRSDDLAVYTASTPCMFGSPLRKRWRVLQGKPCLSSKGSITVHALVSTPARGSINRSPTMNTSPFCQCPFLITGTTCGAVQSVHYNPGLMAAMPCSFLVEPPASPLPLTRCTKWLSYG